MNEILIRAETLGYHSVMSIIADSNDASGQLHKKIEFEPVGFLQRVGFKFNEWQDVAFYQLLLQNRRNWLP